MPKNRGARKLVTDNALRKIVEQALSDWEFGRQHGPNHPVDTMRNVYKSMCSSTESLPDAEVLIISASQYYEHRLSPLGKTHCGYAVKTALDEAEKLKQTAIEEEG